MSHDFVVGHFTSTPAVPSHAPRDSLTVRVINRHAAFVRAVAAALGITAEQLTADPDAWASALQQVRTSVALLLKHNDALQEAVIGGKVARHMRDALRVLTAEDSRGTE